MYFCPKTRFPVPKIILNVKISVNFIFSSFSSEQKWLNKKYYHLRLFLAPGIKFLGKIHWKYFKNFEIIFSAIYLSRVKNQASTCLPLRMTAFSKVHHFFGTPCKCIFIKQIVMKFIIK